EVRLEVTLGLREVPTAKAKPGLLTLVKKMDPTDIWYVPTLAGVLKQREPEFVQELFAAGADETRAVALAWQLQRTESIPYLVGVLKAPKSPDQFAKALEALSWINDPAAGEAIATLAASDADNGRVRAALEMLKRNVGGSWKPVTAKPAFEQLFARCTKEATLVPPFLALVGAAQAQAFVPKVIEMIDQPKTDPALRRAAVEALGQMKSPQAIAKLNEVIARTKQEKPPATPQPTDELALAALLALYGMNAPDATKAVEGLVLERAYPADLRREAVKLLGRTPAGCY